MQIGSLGELTYQMKLGGIHAIYRVENACNKKKETSHILQSIFIIN